MDYKKIENKLKVDAESVRVKDFSLRWNGIQSKSDGVKTSERQSIPVLVSATVTSSNEEVKNSRRKNIRLSLIIVAMTLLISLAILLPILLTQGDDKLYFDEEQLNASYVSETEFYDSLDDVKIEIVSLSDYVVENFCLYYSDDNNLHGGGFDIIDEELSCYVTVVFYDLSVEVKGDAVEYEKYNVGDIQIKYNLAPNDGYYTMNANTVVGEVYYRLNCNIMGSNVTDILDKFFG